MDLYNFERIKKIVTLPDSLEYMQDWILLKDIVPYLESELEDNYILLYASSRFTFLQAVMIPNIKYNQEEIKDIFRWSGGIDLSWSFSCSMTDCCIENPISSFGSAVISTGETIVHLRGLDGIQEYERYFEVNQKIYQSMELHCIHDRRAWCKLDENGDIEETIKTIEIDLTEEDKLTAIVIKKRDLAKYATATNQLLLRMFDVMAYNPSTFQSWPSEREVERIDTGITLGEKTMAGPTGSFVRGIQLVDISIDMQHLVKDIWGDDEKEYVSYIVQDIKHSKVHEVSCNPKDLDSYFIDTGKPFAITPAFFNAEVLRKYKSDTEKYTIKTRTIECRGSWRLRSYDINPEGQISAYLEDLNKLPYREQLHWKQYNEEPKGSISKRAFDNDILGKFIEETEVLEELKKLLSIMNKCGLSWWTLKSENGLTKLHYPLTSSRDEWADEILNFDQLVIEGFNKKNLKNIAESLEATISKNFGTLKILENILIAKGYSAPDAYGIMSVFHEVHDLRNKVKGHVSGNEGEQLRKNALKKYGSYKNHFKSLVEKMVESLQILLDEIGGIKEH